MKQIPVLWVIACCCALLFGQGPKSEAPSKDNAPEYVIGLEDILSINVWKEPELSLKEVVVRPDGKISLPLVNDIQAAGSTPAQLQEKIADKLKEFVASPHVNVAVIRTISRSVSVVGSVNRPGAFPLGAPLTVLEVLARAGGLTELAKPKDIKIVRNENGKTVQLPFNYKEVAKGKNLQQNITLKDGDVVIVP